MNPQGKQPQPPYDPSHPPQHPQQQQQQQYGDMNNRQYYQNLYPQIPATATTAVYPQPHAVYAAPTPAQAAAGPMQQQQQPYYPQMHHQTQQQQPVRSHRSQFPGPRGLDQVPQSVGATMYPPPYYPHPVAQQMYGHQSNLMQQPYYPQQQQLQSQPYQQPQNPGVQMQQAAPNIGGAAPAPAIPSSTTTTVLDSPAFVPPVAINPLLQMNKPSATTTTDSEPHQQHQQQQAPNLAAQRVQPPMAAAYPGHVGHHPQQHAPYVPQPAMLSMMRPPPPPPPLNPGQIYSMDRKAKKNAQSRARASKLRERIELLQTKHPDSLTQEERDILAMYEDRRRRKNERSRERAVEKKIEIEKILNKAGKRRTRDEEETLTIALTAKKKKNEGDRIRRERIKMAQLSAGMNIGRSGRGRPKKQIDPNVYAASMGQANQYMPIQSTDMYAVAAPTYPAYPAASAPGGGYAHSQAAAVSATSTGIYTQQSQQQASYPVQQTQHEDGSVSINIFAGDQQQGGNHSSNTSNVAENRDSTSI